MKTTLNHESLPAMMSHLKAANQEFLFQYPGESGQRQPIHVLYGGAHLFKSETVKRLGIMAQRAMTTYLPNARTLAQIFALPEPLADQVYDQLRDKLAREPVEDLRIDFEDGYGFRPDDEEDAHALSSAEQTAQAFIANSLPPFFGLRIKPLNLELTARSVRTLDLYLTQLCEQTCSQLPANFVITLPKVVSTEQVSAMAELCEVMEEKLHLPAQSLQLELMVETPQSLINTRGEMPLPKMIAAAKGRCRGIHLGAFDYTAACGITASYQDIHHPACDFARALMQAAVAGTGVWLADGVTTTLPIEQNRGRELTFAEQAENQIVMARAWKLHYDNIRHSLRSGFYQSWDLHPAQLVARYAATYAFFLEGAESATIRLRNFLQKAAQATTVGNEFDDVATGQGLLNYFLRALNCGAFNAAQVQAMTGLTIEELQTTSFVKILQTRQK